VSLLAFLPVSKARTNKFYIFLQGTNIVYLFGTNEYQVQNSKGSVTWNLIHRTETILSTDVQQGPRHNIIFPQNFCGHLKKLITEN
jgi:hypothetical protein